MNITIDNMYEQNSPRRVLGTLTNTCDDDSAPRPFED